MKKSYVVELIVTHKLVENTFWMYRGYKTKKKALSVAKMMSKFFPYFENPTTILVKESDLLEGGICQNEKVIKSYKLKDEYGKTVKL